MSILGKDVVFLEHLYLLTHFLVLLGHAYLDLGLKEVDHVVGVYHFGYVLLWR